MVDVFSSILPEVSSVRLGINFVTHVQSFDREFAKGWFTRTTQAQA